MNSHQLFLPHAHKHPLAGVGVRVRPMPSHVYFRYNGGPAVAIDWFDRLFDECVTRSMLELAVHYRLRDGFRASLPNNDAVVISNLKRLFVVHNNDISRDDTVSIAQAADIPQSRPNEYARRHFPRP